LEGIQVNTILVVDDGPNTRNLVLIHLKEEGFTVLEAEDGKKH